MFQCIWSETAVCFERLQVFPCRIGLPSDIMHDILEGVLPRHVKIMLKKLIHEEKMFTLQELNNRISKFPYGLSDSTNKPSSINNLNTADGHLKQSDSQMWCLSRLLPLIIHDLVPEEDPHWQLYLDLVHIMDLDFAPITSKGATYYLHILIRDFLTDFKELYPGVNLVPKHHFMVHYPGQIRRYGPLIRQWCMRGEAKHHYFKKLAHGMTYFKIMCLTLAKRHQRLQCYWLSEEGSYLRSSVDMGPGSTIHLQDFTQDKQVRLLHLYPNISPESTIFRAKWVQLYGTKYNNRNIVISGHHLLLHFLRVEVIFVMPNKDVLLWCKKMHTAGFYRHLWSYEVMLLNDEVSTSYEELADHHPLDCYSLKIDGISKSFVRLRYDISDLE